MNNSDQRKRFDYKWVIIGLCFLMVLVALGFCSSPKSLYIVPISNALGIDRSVYSITDSCRYVSTAIINVFFGFLVAKFGPKKLIVAGFGSLIISTLLYAFAPNVWLIYLAGVFLGIGLSWTTTTMVGYVVTRLCKENKGTIMGAVLASNGIGGAIAIQIISPIIESGAEGYRTAYIVVACVLAVVGVLLLIFFKDPKREPIDAVPAKSGAKKKRGTDWVGISFKEALHKKYFWGILVCIFISGFILQGLSGVTAAHYRDVNIDADTISLILSFHSLVLAAAKFLTGVIYDKAGLRATTSWCIGVSIISSLILVFIDPSPLGIALAFVYSAISSFALPLETIMLPIYASDLFGAKSFDKVLGIFVSVNTAGYALGSPAFNLCYDITKSYNVGFIAAAVAMVAVIVIVQFVISSARKTQIEVLARESAKSTENDAVEADIAN
ncbi:MAG: MFS transporter [Clostridia bacterium]|nr:MFS transporter [Clostridia bacterium]